MHYIISASTDTGNAKKTNQDSLYAQIISAGDERMVFAILCDGMGGLEKGEIASASVIHAYRKWSKERLSVLCACGLTDEVIQKEWCDIATQWNDHIVQYGVQHAINLGTTAVVMLITEKRYYIMNVGDSRAYEVLDACRLLTQDQTVVEREVQMGILTPEQAKNDPRRNILLQCIGASEEVCPDMYFGETGCNAVYMLCSDGFRHEVTEKEMYQYLRPSRMNSPEAMRQNEQALIALNKQRHERDNITVVTIRTCK